MGLIWRYTNQQITNAIKKVVSRPISVGVNVEFKVTLHEQVRYLSTLQY